MYVCMLLPSKAYTKSMQKAMTHCLFKYSELIQRLIWLSYWLTRTGYSRTGFSMATHIVIYLLSIYGRNHGDEDSRYHKRAKLYIEQSYMQREAYRPMYLTSGIVSPSNWTNGIALSRAAIRIHTRRRHQYNLIT